MATSKHNGLWTFHYYANRISRKLFGLRFEAIELAVLGPRLTEYVKFVEVHGYSPHFRNPRSYNEKISHRKLFDRNPHFSLLADKWAVGAFVAPKVRTQYLNAVLFHTLTA